MILVTGASGNNGREVVKLLAQQGRPVRALVRKPEQAHDLAALPGVTLVAGDFDDRASLDRALAGVERAFLLTPSTARAEGQQLGFVDAARGAGVRHIVKLSQLAADRGSPVRFLRYHAAVEEALRGSGLDWTFLRPNLYMQALLGFADGIRKSGVLAAAIGAEARVSLVDVRDNAAAAVAALTQDGHAGKTYTLTGPQALTHGEIAARIGAAGGRAVRFETVAPAQMRAGLAQTGMDAWQADGLIEDYAHYARGEAAAVADGVRAASGQEPRSLAAFAAENAADFSQAMPG